jgi:hypothetical protein
MGDGSPLKQRPVVGVGKSTIDEDETVGGLTCRCFTVGAERIGAAP